jgi:hypothetical protein
MRVSPHSRYFSNIFPIFFLNESGEDQLQAYLKEITDVVKEVLNTDLALCYIYRISQLESYQEA